MCGLQSSAKAPRITSSDGKIIHHLKVKLLSPQTRASCCLQSDFLFFSCSEGKINEAQSGEILAVFPIHLWFETLDALRQLDTLRYRGDCCHSLHFHHVDFITYSEQSFFNSESLKFRFLFSEMLIKSELFFICYVFNSSTKTMLRLSKSRRNVYTTKAPAVT